MVEFRISKFRPACKMSGCARCLARSRVPLSYGVCFRTCSLTRLCVRIDEKPRIITGFAWRSTCLDHQQLLDGLSAGRNRLLGVCKPVLSVRCLYLLDGKSPPSFPSVGVLLVLNVFGTSFRFYRNFCSFLFSTRVQRTVDRSNRPRLVRCCGTSTTTCSTSSYASRTSACTTPPCPA